MIKTLHKKFVVTAMMAITILMVILLGIINIANVCMLKNETSKNLSIIADSKNNKIPPGVMNGDRNKPEKRVGPDDKSITGRQPGEFKPKDERDKMFSLNYFVVYMNSEGQVTEAEVDHMPSMDMVTAKDLALEEYDNKIFWFVDEEIEKIDDENNIQGNPSIVYRNSVGKYRYESRTTESETIIVFLDTTDEVLSSLRVLLVSIVAGMVAWLFMLVIVVFLSKKAIRPIAENMEKQKQFITNAGHEIKTPLSIIMSNTDAMELINGENKWSKNIREQTVRLDGLMKHLLSLARYDEGGVKAVPVWFSLDELVKDCIGSFTELMAEKGIETTLDIQPDVSINADKQQIAELLCILLDNAAKYTDKNGSVEVSLKRENKKSRLVISNSCDMLPTVSSDKLFDRFYREDKARTQKNGGYGIGLSIAQSIVEVNGGDIKAEYGDDKISFIVILYS